MFTGIISNIGVITNILGHSNSYSIQVSCDSIDFSTVKIGDSIATNGVCLTVTKLLDNSFYADVSHETFGLTNLSSLTIGCKVNLERAMSASDRFDGHIVTGHVDGIGIISSIRNTSSCTDYFVKVSSDIIKFIAKKGSVAVDGVSLTVNELTSANEFRLTIIPHTSKQTCINYWKVGDKVNVEVDLMARYIERLLQGQSLDRNKGYDGLTKNTLFENGFI